MSNRRKERKSVFSFKNPLRNTNPRGESGKTGMPTR